MWSPVLLVDSLLFLPFQFISDPLQSRGFDEALKQVGEVGFLFVVRNETEVPGSPVVFDVQKLPQRAFLLNVFVCFHGQSLFQRAHVAHQECVFELWRKRFLIPKP
jgi:hypothetical protein